MTPECTKLIHHISRIEGQLASIKKELQQPSPNCIQASQTLYSAARSFAGFRQAFIATFLERYGIFDMSNDDATDAYSELLKLIKS
jgi:DNA-binding FrmR family transcriptional regulator